MYHVYVIQSETGLRYIGQTDDIKKRLQQHNEGRSRYTKRCKTWKLLYQEEFPTRKEAIIREAELKTGTGRRYLKNIFNNLLGS